MTRDISFTGGHCVKNACVDDPYVRNIYTKSASIIEYLVIYLQFFQILEVRYVRLKIQIKTS